MTHTEALRMALDALLYHTEMTRPIQKTADAIVELRAALAAPAHAPDARWYCVTRDGAATLCVDQDDAQTVADEQDDLHPRNGPHRAVRLIEATAQPAPAAVPAGWQLVPVEPTQAMLQDGSTHCGMGMFGSDDEARKVYAAMLAAAPQQAPTAHAGEKP